VQHGVEGDRFGGPLLLQRDALADFVGQALSERARVARSQRAAARRECGVELVDAPSRSAFP
jgi:hypothetical protein